jgi:cell division protein FtsZ
MHVFMTQIWYSLRVDLVEVQVQELLQLLQKLQRSMGILTVGIVTKPFSFEGKKRSTNAEEGMKKIKDAVDTLIVVPNDKIFTIVDKKTTFKQAFTMIDKILFLGSTRYIWSYHQTRRYQYRLRRYQKVMKDSGNALLGIGYGAGEKRAVDAARKAIENPLLETNLDGANKVIIAVAGGPDLDSYRSTRSCCSYRRNCGS